MMVMRCNKDRCDDDKNYVASADTLSLHMVKIMMMRMRMKIMRMMRRMMKEKSGPNAIRAKSALIVKILFQLKL